MPLKVNSLSKKNECEVISNFPQLLIITLGAFACLVFLLLKHGKLFESATEKLDLKMHLSLSVTVCVRKHANRLSRPKVGISVVV